MTVRVVRTEDPAERPPLRLIAPVEPGPAAPEVPVMVEAEAPPAPSPAPQAVPPESETLQQSLNVVAVLTALAEVVSVRFALILALLGAFVLTAFGEHTVLSTVNAAAFDILVVIPLIALALRKG